MVPVEVSNSPFPFAPIPPDSAIFGRSPAMGLVKQTVEKVAPTNVPILICGENGTGKEVVAKLIHCRSPWEDTPFVKVSCPAIPGTLIESEMFGYERGAFTGAYNTKPGRVELADGGTLLLDEIAELDPAIQAKLLNLLQDGQFSRIGAQEDKKVDLRVVCATNRHLEQEIEAGNFRRDLYYRINVVTILMPPLRERCVDIPDLLDYFLQVYRHRYNKQARPISPAVVESLQNYHWPGNIRQLENLVRRYVILDSKEALVPEHEGHDDGPVMSELRADGTIPLKQLTRQAVREVERRTILVALQANHWNRKRAALALKISYRALLYKMQSAGLPSKRFTSQGAAVASSVASSEPKSAGAKSSGT